MKLSARICKKLRGLARARSVGMPERRLLGIKRIVRIGERSYEQWQAVNDPKSTRGIYRTLKKAVRGAA